MKKTPIPVLFINSAAYSGSTLLTRLLLAHPDIASVGELSGYVRKNEDPKARYCSCGERLSDCTFWKELEGRLRRTGVIFNPEAFGTQFRLFPYRYRVLNAFCTGSFGSNTLDHLRTTGFGQIAPYRQALTEITRKNEIYIETICEMTGARIFLDSSKYAGRARFLGLSKRLDLHVVHLTRDSRGVVNSYRKNAGLNVIYGSLKWNASQAKSDSLKRWICKKYMHVRYEDLCRDPLCNANSIFSFIELPPLTGLPAEPDGSGHIIGNRMRQTGVAKIREDISWKRELTAGQVALVDMLTRRRQKQFGYLQ